MQPPSRRARILSPSRRSACAALATGIVLALAACATGERREPEPPAGANAAAAATDAEAGLSTAERVERTYVVGPALARTLGYRVDWQYPSSGAAIRMTEVAGDSVFTLDERNFLSRLRREEGDRIWRIPVADPIEVIFGITYVPSVERIYLTTGSDIFVLDAASGSRIAKQRLDKTANTAPVLFDQFLVYGSRSGQLVWHSYLLDSDWRGYQISPSIQVAPIYDDGYIIAVGSDGRIMNLVASSASQVWSRRALDEIVASPVAGNGAVYVASRDQHLRAYDLATPRSPLWEYLTESALTESPTLVGDRVYQQVPSEGLVCLEALPIDRPGGRVIWTCAGCKGSVVARRRGNLLVWDAAGRTLTVVDDRTGVAAESFDLPEVDSVMTTDPDGGNLYFTSVDGRIERLVARN